MEDILLKHPANVRYLDHMSTFNDFGIIGEIVPELIAHPMQKYHVSQPSALFDEFSDGQIGELLAFFIPPEGDDAIWKNSLIIL